MALTLAGLPTVNQYDVNKFILEPLFMGQDYMQYMDVMTDIKGTTVIDKFTNLGKITKAFTDDAFNSESVAAGATVTVTPARLEAEIQFRANSLFNKIKGQLMRGSFDFDNIEGTAVKNILLELISNSVKYDMNRQLWLSDSSSANADYGNYDGLFQAAAEASATQLTNGDLTVAQGEGALASGGGVGILKDLYDNASPELLEAGQHVYFVSGDIADDYMKATLENTSYAAAGYGTLVNGMPQLTFRGIPVIVRRDWDVHIAADFANINGTDAATETHRAMLTTQDAFVVGTDFDANSIEQWYSNDNKAYRFRVSYMIGCALKDSKLAVVYTPEAITV